MTLLDPAIPRLLPEGRYSFEIAAEPEKKSNNWGGFYWQLKFFVESSSGSHYNFTDIFSQTDDRYASLLICLGGMRDKEGTVRLPDMSFTGKKFDGEIQHVQSKTNEKVYAKLVNPIPMKESPTADEKVIF